MKNWLYFGYKKSHTNVVYLNSEFLLVTIVKTIYFIVWPQAKSGSFLLWMINCPPTWRKWMGGETKKKTKKEKQACKLGGGGIWFYT